MSSWKETWNELNDPVKDRTSESIAESKARMRESLAKLGIKKKEKAERAEKVKPAQKPLDFDTVVGVLAVMLSLVCLAVGGFYLRQGLTDKSEYDGIRETHEATIAKLEAKLEDLRQYKGKGEEAVRLDVTGAETAGKYIADIQNRYLASPPYTWVENGRMTDDEWQAAYDELYNGAKEMIMDGTGQQGAWYIPPEIYLSEEGETPFEWRFERVYNYTDSYVPVVWTCWKDKGEHLIAYATGQYRFEDGKVGKITVNTTAYGQKLYDEINSKLLTYDFNDGNITDEQREALIKAMEADLEMQTQDVDSTVADILEALGKGGGNDAED